MRRRTLCPEHQQGHINQHGGRPPRPHPPHPLLLLLCISEQFADVGLRLAHVFVQDLGSIDDLWLPGVQHLSDLPGHQCLTTAWGAEQQDALHVFTS